MLHSRKHKSLCMLRVQNVRWGVMRDVSEEVDRTQFIKEPVCLQKEFFLRLKDFKQMDDRIIRCKERHIVSFHVEGYIIAS